MAKAVGPEDLDMAARQAIVLGVAGRNFLVVTGVDDKHRHCHVSQKAAADEVCKRSAGDSLHYPVHRGP